MRRQYPLALSTLEWTYPLSAIEAPKRTVAVYGKDPSSCQAQFRPSVVITLRVMQFTHAERDDYTIFYRSPPSVVITLRVMQFTHAERDDYTIFYRSP